MPFSNDDMLHDRSQQEDCEILQVPLWITYLALQVSSTSQCCRRVFPSSSDLVNLRFDDNKIVDLAIGEKNVFKRRGQREDRNLIQSMPKRLSFVVDVSGSMAVFNGDGRLDRLCATMVMIMESLVGLEHKSPKHLLQSTFQTFWDIFMVRWCWWFREMTRINVLHTFPRRELLHISVLLLPTH